MRLKLDENLPADLADEFAGRGHDVDTVLDEHLGGSKDAVVVGAPTGDDRTVITLDRGVGDVRNFPGVVVLRPVSQDPASILGLVRRFLSAHDLAAFSRCVVVVEPNRVRVRRPEDLGRQ